MVDFREIRLGNYLFNAAGKQCAVGGVTPHSVMLTRIENGILTENRELLRNEVSPINVDVNVLKNLGFTLNEPFEDSRPIYSLGDFYVDYDTLQPIDSGFPISKVDIKYVHQLQNLYFDITGKELTL